MPKVKVIGKHSSILPFKAVGVEPVDVEDVEGAKAALRALREEEGEILILLPEDYAIECEAEIGLLRQGVSKVVLSLPASTGKAGAQREHVRQMVARSLGVDLMGKK